MQGKVSQKSFWFIYLPCFLLVLGGIVLINFSQPEEAYYWCENGANFPLEFVDENTVVSSKPDVMTFKLESSEDSRIKTFGNDEYAVTFTEGYEGKLIFTHRKAEGPSSTFCEKVEKTQ